MYSDWDYKRTWENHSSASCRREIRREDKKHNVKLLSSKLFSAIRVSKKGGMFKF